MSDGDVISYGKNRVNYVTSETSPKKIINDGPFIISVIDAPMENTKAEAEDGITDRQIEISIYKGHLTAQK